MKRIMYEVWEVLLDTENRPVEDFIYETSSAKEAQKMASEATGDAIRRVYRVTRELLSRGVDARRKRGSSRSARGA